MESVKKNALFYIISDNFSKLVAIVTTIFVIRLVDINLYGAISHVRSVPIFIAGLAWLGMDNVFFRTTHLRTRHLLIGYILIIFALISLVLSIGVSVFPQLYIGKKIFYEYNLISSVIFIFSFLALLQLFINSMAIAYEKAKIASMISIFLSIFTLISNILIIYYRNITMSLVVMIVAYLTLYLIITCIYKKLIISNMKAFLNDIFDSEMRNESFSDMKKQFNFFKYYSISNVLDTVSKRIAAIYFAGLGDTSILAIISLFNQFSDMVQSFSYQINNSWGVNRLKLLIIEFERDKIAFSKSLTTFFEELKIINFLIISLFILLLPFWLPAFVYMIGKWNLDYLVVFSLIGAITIRYNFEFLGNVLQYNQLYVLEKIGSKILIYTLLNLVLIPLNLFFARAFGIYGALLASLVPGITLFVIGEKLLKSNYGTRKRILMRSMLVFPLISFCYYPSSVRYTFFLSIVGTIILFLTNYSLLTKDEKNKVRGVVYDGYIVPILIFLKSLKNAQT